MNFEDLATPRDIETERSLLQAILVRPDILDRILQIAEGGDFSDRKHRLLFDAMVRLRSERNAIDARTLIDGLRSAGDLDEVGGSPYILEIAAADGIPSHGPEYARVIHELALRRDFGILAHQYALKSSDPENDSGQLLAFLEADLARLSQRQIQVRPSTADVLSKTAANLENVVAEACSTGFARVDKALSGGLRPGELVVLAALTGRGKSAFALNISANIVRAGGGALFLSVEMQESELARRLLFGEAAVSHLRLLDADGLEDSERERITYAADLFAKLKLEIQYRPGLDPMTARALAQRFSREWGGIRLVVCDYIGLMRPNTPQERREREVAAITRELKLIAGELQCCVLAVAQLNREIAHRKNGRPQLSDLRDSGAVEQDADIVAFLHETRDRRGYELIIDKNRRGPRTKIELDFRSEMTKFEETAPRA